MPAIPRAQFADPNRDRMEHRWGRRIPCGGHVRLSAEGGTESTGRMRDVSSSGAFIETTSAFPLSARLLVTVAREPTSAARTVSLNASVVRVAADGVGVEWCETPSRSICRTLGCDVLCAAATCAEKS